MVMDMLLYRSHNPDLLTKVMAYHLIEQLLVTSWYLHFASQGRWYETLPPVYRGVHVTQALVFCVVFCSQGRWYETLPPVYRGVHVTQALVFCVVFCGSGFSFVLFLLNFLYWITAFNYLFGIIKRLYIMSEIFFSNVTYKTYHALL